MDAFVWSPLFETGLSEVDTQHQQLVALVNQLGRDMHGAEPARIDQALHALVDYTLHHFSCEEALMEREALDPVYIARHRQTHQRFVQQVGTWTASRERGQGIALPQMLEFLANWLVFHIMGDDQSLGRQVQAVQAGKSAHAAFTEDRASDDPRTDVLLQALRRLYTDLVQRNETLLATQDALSTLNAELEERVSTRTAELQQLNQALREEQAQRIESEKMASLGRMVAGFAHELNTPVGVAVSASSQTQELLGSLRSLLTQDEVDAQQLFDALALLDETTDLALSNLRRAAAMMQSFKRTAVDQTSEAERVYDLAEVVEDALKSLAHALRLAHVTLQVTCAPGQRLFGQAGAVVQILTNLAQNSLIHAFEDGKRAGVITVEAGIHGEDVCVVFQDDGVGMGENVQTRLFEPFYTTRRANGGSGLGAFIAYKLVTEVLHGSIQCESQVGAGTRFTIHYPRQDPRPLPASEEETP